jgi:hypothetical protein
MALIQRCAVDRIRTDAAAAVTGINLRAIVVVVAGIKVGVVDATAGGVT